MLWIELKEVGIKKGEAEAIRFGPNHYRRRKGGTICEKNESRHTKKFEEIQIKQKIRNMLKR